jgi:hypothetical protein
LLSAAATGREKNLSEFSICNAIHFLRGKMAFEKLIGFGLFRGITLHFVRIRNNASVCIKPVLLLCMLILKF